MRAQFVAVFKAHQACKHALAKFSLILPAVTCLCCLLGIFNSNDVYMYLSMYVCMYVCICLIDFLEIKKNNFRFTKESQNYTEFLYTTPLVFSNVYLLHKHRIVMKTKKLILV